MIFHNLPFFADVVALYWEIDVQIVLDDAVQERNSSMSATDHRYLFHHATRS